MKNSLTQILVYLIFSAVVLGQNRADDIAASISRTASLLRIEESNRREYNELLKNRESGKELTEEQMQRFSELRDAAMTAHEGAKDIISRVKEGNNVFQYPGLLAMGRVFYNLQEDVYGLDIKTGTWTSTRINFSSTGSISKLTHIVPVK